MFMNIRIKSDMNAQSVNEKELINTKHISMDKSHK